MRRCRCAVLAVLGYVAWRCCSAPTPTTLSLRIGQTFEEVVAASSFPVMAESDRPADNPDGSGATWVSKPAVIIQFNDPKYGFTAPPTTFAAIGYIDNRVSSIATSPILQTLPFEEAVAIIEFLQKQFMAGGWELVDDTTWFDLSLKNREVLHQIVRNEETGQQKVVGLIAPKKYSLTFRLICVDRCDSRLGLDSYLINVGVRRI
jgi:hypothetical protein